jgi:hypothetical protein
MVLLTTVFLEGGGGVGLAKQTPQPPKKLPPSLQINIPIHIYRVSIKSFPDYKHLLQEHYVEYKLFFHY